MIKILLLFLLDNHHLLYLLEDQGQLILLQEKDKLHLLEKQVIYVSQRPFVKKIFLEGGKNLFAYL